MYAIDFGNGSDHDIISTEMLERVSDRSQSHPNVNIRESCYRICDRIRQRQSEWKEALKSTRSTGKGLHKLFSTVVKEISLELKYLGESDSEVSHFVTEPRNFAEVKKIK